MQRPSALGSWGSIVAALALVVSASCSTSELGDGQGDAGGGAADAGGDRPGNDAPDARPDGSPEEGGLRSVTVGLGGGLAFHGPSSLYMTGTFQGTVDFDPGPGVDERTAVGDSDGYLWHLTGLPPLPEASGAPAP